MKKQNLVFWVFALLITISTFPSCNQDIFDGEFGDNETTEQNDGGGIFDNIFGKDYIALYEITDDLIALKDEGKAPESWMEETFRHQEIWAQVVKLLDRDNRSRFADFEVFYGENELLGYVEPMAESDLSQWKVGLAIDLAYIDDTFDKDKELTYTIIHEFAHVLSLNESQVDASSHSCSTYNPGEGCSYEESYINLFFDRFWKDIYEEHQSNDVENDLDAGLDFYNKYQDHFVTEYASTNPAEDIAEVFSVFVAADNAPTGNKVKDQKVRFMYEFEELVAMRAYMKENGSALMKPGGWRKAKRYKNVTH